MASIKCFSDTGLTPDRSLQPFWVSAKDIKCPFRPGRHGTERPLQNRSVTLALVFVEAARFQGGQLFAFRFGPLIRPRLFSKQPKRPAQNEISGYSRQGGVKMAAIGRPFQKAAQLSAGI
jgi:hypothetical protein